ncbi:phage tail tape measure protein [Mediterraneibacter gnavus]|uniref:phage tail tape measure protein n=1 Tax=Mediterraneibacter gnavus TaxID=33038 RepID=UPI000464DF6A|nr:phage tail tape measure protein [Mediterraneibacter gnavus]
MANKKIKGITIKFGADTTALDKALKDADKTSRSLGGELKSVNRLLKFDPKNTQLLTQKQQLLNEQIGNTNKKLDALKQAQSEVEQKFKSGDLGAEEYREFQREIAKTEQDLKSYTSQLEKLNDVYEKVASKINDAGETVKKIGGKVSDAGKALAPLSGAFAGAGLVSSKMSMGFEEAIAKVSTIADETEVPISELKKGIKNLSNQTGISATEIADNVYDAISAGQKTGDALAFVKKSTKLAKAGFADAGNALDILTTIMNAYGLEASEVGKVSDMLIQTQNAGKTTVGELASTMGRLIPTAKANNVALDQVTTGYVKLTSNGVSAAESTTYMNAMLNELGKSGTKVSDLLKEKTGQSFSELMQSGMSLADVLEIVSNGAEEQGLAFGDMWGSSEAAKAGLVLLGDGAQEFNATLDEMRNSTGATEEALEKLETKSDKFRKTFNELKNVMIELGDALMEVLAPVIENVTKKVKEFSKWFSGLSDESKKMIAIGIIIVAALSPILIIIGKIIKGIGIVIKVVGAVIKVVGFIVRLINPVMLTIAAIIAVVAAVVAVIKNWGDITDWLSEKWNAFKDWMSGLWDSISEKIQGVWNGIKDFFADIWEQIYNVIEGPLKFIEGTIGAVMYAIQAVIYTVWEVIKFALKSAWDWISDTASAIFTPVANFFSGIWNGIKDTATGIWNSIKDTLGGIWDSIKEKAMDAFSSVWKFIKDGFNNLKDTLGGIVKGIANAIVKPIGGAVNGVINGVNWVLDKVGSDKQFALWEVPKFARGTGGIPKDTLGIVNDQKGSTYKEMIVPPHGKPFIPEGRDVVLPLEKGTKIMPANQTKSFLEELPHFASGIGEFFGGVWDTVKDFTGNVWDYITHPSKIVQIAIDKFTDLTGAFEPWISVAKGAVNTVFDSVVGFVKGIFDTQSHVNYNPSAGVEQWRTLATRALQMTGQYSEANLERLLYQMQTESGGNPNAINNWDINAINGTPSKGLMQVIDPTFRAYAMPGYDKNIYDPLSNMLASIRYAVSTYGSLAAAYRGVGYENGIGDINLSDLLPSLPMLDVKWFKDGGILTKPALFQMPSGGIGGAAEREAEAITPLRSLKGYIKESILEIMGEKDINLNINLTTTLDGRVVAQQTVGYARPMIKKMDDFEKLLGGERVGLA